MNITSAHIVVINNEGKILLTQRQDLPIWVIPGGHFNENETAEEAVIRELYEETGIRIHHLKLIARYYSKNEVKKTLFCAQFRSNIVTKRSLEVRKIHWFKPKQLPNPMSLYETQKITDYLSFKGQIINRTDFVSRKKEFFHQIKTPLTFFWLLAFFIKNQLTTKSFKF